MVTAYTADVDVDGVRLREENQRGRRPSRCRGGEGWADASGTTF
jgi:hypothetical protein